MSLQNRAVGADGLEPVAGTGSNDLSFVHDTVFGMSHAGIIDHFMPSIYIVFIGQGEIQKSGCTGRSCPDLKAQRALIVSLKT